MRRQASGLPDEVAPGGRIRRDETKTRDERVRQPTSGRLTRSNACRDGAVRQPALASAAKIGGGDRRDRVMVVALLLTLNELSAGFFAGRLALPRAHSRSIRSVRADGYAAFAPQLRSYRRRRSKTRCGRCPAACRRGDRQLSFPAATVRERQWRNAQKNLVQAGHAGASRSTVESGARYCEGHIYRIDGVAGAQRRCTPNANSLFAEAVTIPQKGRTAERLARSVPGLARTFIYGLKMRSAPRTRCARRSGAATPRSTRYRSRRRLSRPRRQPPRNRPSPNRCRRKIGVSPARSTHTARRCALRAHSGIRGHRTGPAPHPPHD